MVGVTVFLRSKSAIVRASLRTLKSSRFEGKRVVSSRCLAASSRVVFWRMVVMLAVPLGAPKTANCFEITPVIVFFTSFCEAEF